MTDSAHPQPVSEAAQFSEQDRYVLQFNGPHSYDKMWVYPKHRAAIYFTELNITHNMPTNYTYYVYQTSKSAQLSSDALNLLLTFEQAETIIIRDAGHAAHRLLRSLNEGNRLKNLRHLALAVSGTTWPELQIRPFLVRLPALQQLSLDLSKLTSVEMSEFVGNQTIPSAWKVHGFGSALIQSNFQLHKRH